MKIAETAPQANDIEIHDSEKSPQDNHEIEDNKNAKDPKESERSKESKESKGSERSKEIQVGTNCYHCGGLIAQDVSPNVESSSREVDTAIQNYEGHIFCCHGCQAAYQFIQSSNLGEYYSHREDFSPQPKEVETSVFDFWERDLAQEGQVYSGEFIIEGVHCASCIWLNERLLQSLPGIISAEAVLLNRRLNLKYDSKQISLRQIAEKLHRLGYQIKPIDAKSSSTNKVSDDLLKRMGVAGFCAGNLMLISVALYSGFFGSIDLYSKNFLHLASLMLTIPLLVYSASVFFRNAWASLRFRVFSTDLLTASGISLAFMFSTYNVISQQGEVFYDSMGFVTFVLLVGRFIERRLMERNQTYIENISSVLANVATKIEPGVTDEEKQGIIVPVKSLVPGDLVKVESGEVVPADGILRSSSCEFDESAITGESVGVLRLDGALVYAGARPIQSVVIEVRSRAEDSVISFIRRAASDGPEPRILRLTERSARIFLGFALIASLVTFLSWWLRGDTTQAVLSTVALLIAACPCALSLAVPTAYNVGLSLALRSGIILKQGRALEDLSTIKTIALDKTGTLTEGSPEIAEVVIHYAFSKPPERKASQVYAILGMANILEKKADSPHPIRQAFAKATNDISDSAFDSEFFLDSIAHAEYTPGKGIVARSNENTIYLLGSRRLMEDYKVELSAVDNESSSLVYFAASQWPRNIPKIHEENEKFTHIGTFIVRDKLRIDATSFVSGMKQKYEMMMLTGDRHSAAKLVAHKIGIQDIRAELSPFEKQKIIEDEAKNQPICMIGDGINDGAALAAAHVGIAFSTSADIPLVGASVVIPGNRLHTITQVFAIAKATRTTIIQNITLSFAYNILLIPLAMGGVISPFVGAILMSASSITVLLNSLLLRHKVSREKDSTDEIQRMTTEKNREHRNEYEND